jgi:hypothetical protein
MRALLIAERAPKTRNAIPRIYSYAIEHSAKRIKELLPSVPVIELAKALGNPESARFTSDQEHVLNACWVIFERTHCEPESVSAVHSEITAMLKGKERCVPSVATVYNVLNRLGIPTKPGKRGPARGTRHKITSKKRP